MDTVTVGLIIAIIVMLILLMSCSQGGKKKVRKGSCSDGMDKAPATNSSVAEPDMYFANSGGGLINHQLNKQYADLADLSGYDDYNQLAQYSALEPEVYESHKEYSADMNRSTSGASMMTIRTDPNDVNPWRGLRRPDYHSVYADSTARVDQSEVPETMYSQTRYCI
jgi:hypothetical protein